MNSFQSILVAFEPATDGQEILHEETLRAYNNLIEARRMRVDAALTHLPGLMWIVVLSGAVISLCASFFFSVTFAFDRPFVGDLGVSAEPYQLIYDQLMKPQQ